MHACLQLTLRCSMKEKYRMHPIFVVLLQFGLTHCQGQDPGSAAPHLQRGAAGGRPHAGRLRRPWRINSWPPPASTPWQDADPCGRDANGQGHEPRGHKLRHRRQCQGQDSSVARLPQGPSQCLIFANRQLDDDGDKGRTLADLNIPKHPPPRPPQPGAQQGRWTSAWRLCEVNSIILRWGAQIPSIMSRRRSGLRKAFPLGQQCLIFGGKIMEDGRTLTHYNIQMYDSLFSAQLTWLNMHHMVIAPWGVLPWSSYTLQCVIWIFSHSWRLSCLVLHAT